MPGAQKVLDEVVHSEDLPETSHVYFKQEREVVFEKKPKNLAWGFEHNVCEKENLCGS